MKLYNYSQTPAIYYINSPSETPVLFYQKPMSIGNPVCSDVRFGTESCFCVKQDRLILITGHEDSSRLVSIDKRGVLTELLDYKGSVDSFDAFGNIILYVGMRDMAPQELFCLDINGDRQVSFLNEQFLKDHDVIKCDELFFKNSAGSEIHGFVLKPDGWENMAPGSCPGILNIHGGPRLSYGEVFFHEIECQVHAGYFVFFCNPRGSDGRGDDFAYIRGKYGTIEYQDIMEFTDEVLKKYPAIAPGRLGVSGGSYGGFMVNWIIGKTDRFAAAVSQRGIANFISFEGTSDVGRTFVTGHIGALTEDNPELLWSQSPLKNADNVVTPTLFIHSDEDYRCWKIESFQMFTALRRNRIDARMCLFKKENHELSRSGRPKNRAKRLWEIMEFLNNHLRQEEHKE
jgi:dipeptidyl aminopeptidase/acylaminoacyl peptidase